MKLHLRAVCAIFGLLVTIVLLRLGLREWSAEDLKIFVYEEHHEVIPRWVKNSERADRQQPLRLLHVDAHADLAFPRLHPDLPLFRRPASPREVSAMMQKNDVFIVAAATSRLINQVVWLYPTWMASSVTAGTSLLGLGLEKGTPVSASVCGCLSPSSCLVDDESGDSMSSLNCETAVILRLSSVSENQTVPNVAAPFILDIDEDFFGVQKPVSLLKEAGLSKKQVSRLTSLVGRYFRGAGARMEHRADCWFQALLRCPPLSGVRCWMGVQAKFPIGRSQHRVFSALWQVLRSLNSRQRAALSTVGVCLNISPHTFIEAHGATAGWHLGLCLGASSSYHQADSLPIHPEPRDDEIAHQMKRLMSTLSSLHRPDLITVCRSGRDGFLPRRNQKFIEESLLKGLQDVYNIPDSSVVFDKSLWRHRSC